MILAIGLERSKHLYVLSRCDPEPREHLSDPIIHRYRTLEIDRKNGGGLLHSNRNHALIES
jgi:hypothetical protein